MYQEKPSLTFTPGAECSGVVTTIAEDVQGESSLYVGARVMAFCANLGAWSTFVDVPVAYVFVIPSSFGSDAIAFERAAAMPVVAGTAWLAWHLCGVKHRAMCRTDTDCNDGHDEQITVLVTGASGGAGSAAVILAKALGVKVIACARGQRKVNFCSDVLRADYTVDVSDESVSGLSKQVRRLVPGGVHAAFDSVGGRCFTECIRSTRWGGRVAIVGFASGTIPSVSANVLLVKGVSVVGVYFGADMQRRPLQARALFCEMLDVAARNKCFLPIARTFALQQASDAVQFMESGHVTGKVILTVPHPWPKAVNQVDRLAEQSIPEVRARL